MKPEVTARTNSIALFSFPIASRVNFLPCKAFHMLSSFLFNSPSKEEATASSRAKLTLVMFDLLAFASPAHISSDIFTANERNPKVQRQKEICQGESKNIFPFTQTAEEKLCRDKWNFLFGFKAFFCVLLLGSKSFWVKHRAEPGRRRKKSRRIIHQAASALEGFEGEIESTRRGFFLFCARHVRLVFVVCGDQPHRVAFYWFLSTSITLGRMHF